jgi:hypothetical protein
MSSPPPLRLGASVTEAARSELRCTSTNAVGEKVQWRIELCVCVCVCVCACICDRAVRLRPSRVRRAFALAGRQSHAAA